MASRKPPKPFIQAVLASMERCALYIFRYLDVENADRLSTALRYARAELELPPPKYALLDCRDWPTDEICGEKLAELLTQFEKLEYPPK